MRWKLMFIAAAVAGITGTGLIFALVRTLYGSARRFPITYDSAALAVLFIPLIAITLASIFVYRHTARRRKLQALVTAVFALLFTLTLFIVGSMFFSKQMPSSPSPAPSRAVS